MALRFPSYYKDFVCIANKCSDNCCIGWEIDVDPDTLKKYRSFGGEIGEKIRSAISFDDNPHFLLHNNRCKFLNERNLCGLLLEIGEENLCEICAKHPRYYEWYETLTEVGVGMSCEEAARLILTSGFSLICDGEFEEDSLTTAMFTARERLFGIISNKSLSPSDKVKNILLFCKKMQPMLDEEDIDGITVLSENYSLIKHEKCNTDSRINELIDVYAGLEALEDTWTEKLTALKTSSVRKSPWNYDSILSYFVFRYFMKAATDGDVISKAAITASSFIMINLLDSGLTELSDRISVCKEYSKEVEYSEEALDALYSLSETFSAEDFIAMLP